MVIDNPKYEEHDAVTYIERDKKTFKSTHIKGADIHFVLVVVNECITGYGKEEYAGGAGCNIEKIT